MSHLQAHPQLNPHLHTLHTALQAIQTYAPQGAQLRQDSRAVQRGDVFVAHSGAVHDGRSHIAAAFAAGASCVLAEAHGFTSADPRVITVQDLKSQLGPLAAAFYDHPSAALDCLALTGTNGKTTVSLWAAQLLQSVSQTPSAVVGTLGAGVLGKTQSTGLTTPQACDMQRILAECRQQGARSVCIEASSIGWCEGRLNAVAFTVAAFTNLTQDHLDYHGSMAAYTAAKRELFDLPSLHTAVLNVDDAVGAAWAQALHAQRPTLRIISTGFAAQAHLRASAATVLADGTQRFTMHFGDRSLPVTLGALGLFNIHNCLTAVASVMALGHDMAAIVPHIAALRGAAGRMEVVPSPAHTSSPRESPLVVVDYAHTPDGLQQALQALRPLATQRGGQLSVVFGCGGDRDVSKRPLMGAIAAQFADAVVITNDNPRSESPQRIASDIAAGNVGHNVGGKVGGQVGGQVGGNALIVLDRAAAIATTIGQARASDVVLIAGKGHETTQTVGALITAFSDVVQAQAALKAKVLDTLSFAKIGQWLPHARLQMPAHAQPEPACVGVTSDSRSVQAGQLFVALAGDRFDGHDFLDRAAAQAAGAALVNDGAPQVKQACAIPLMLVPDTGAALQALAHHFRLQFSLPLAVVVGSNGKTTVKEMIATIFQTHCLSDGAGAYAAHSTQGNFNNAIGLPLTLLKLSSAHRLSVVELGMNHPGETSELAAIAAPTIAVINNAQREHQEFMHTVAAVAQEHACVLDALPLEGVAVLPAQDTYFPLWQARAAGRRVIDFALHSAADDTPAAVTGTTQAQGLSQVLTMSTPQGAARIVLQTAGEHNARNALAATAAALAAGLPLASIVAGLQAFNPVKGRMQQHTTPYLGGQLTVIDDSYNANPDSVAAAIAVLDTQAVSTGQRCLLVLGDMGEVGDQGERFHREVGAAAAASRMAALYTVGPLCAHAHAAFVEAAQRQAVPGVAQHFDNALALAQHVLGTLRAGDTVLVKGSRFMAMERVVQALLDPAHMWAATQTTQTIPTIPTIQTGAH